MARHRKGTTRSRGRLGNGCPRGGEYEGLLVRLPSPQGLASGGNSRGVEASAAAQPATGGRSRRHDRRCFGRLEQEDQRLKKHYSRWMDIVRSLQLESFILTKLIKPLVRVNLVGPQVSLRKGAPQMSGGGIIFWATEGRISVIKEEACIRWMDIQRPLLLEPCVDYNKLTKPCIRVNLLFLGDAST